MDTRVADALIGTLVDGRYRVRTRVASGGMATVYTAIDERLERTVALKIIHPGQATDPRFVDRFTREAKTIARLTHPNVVAVYDQGTHDGLPYLVMEYVRGSTLRDLLNESRRFQPEEALAVLEQMLAAIAAAHRAGVVHRDIKPENVLVAAAPGGTNLADAVVKVADFGLARAVEASAEEGDGQLLATVAYVAPELVTDGHADPRSDVYSVGIVLFEMLTGRVPYDGAKPIEVAWRHVDDDVPPPSKYDPEIPPELDDLVLKATRRDADARPSDGGTMLADVQVARDLLEANASLRGRTSAQPTVAVEMLGNHTRAMPATSPSSRPEWARLPSDGRASGGHRRASRGASVAAAGAGAGGGRQFANWFAQVMARKNGRRTFYATLAVLAVLVSLTGWWFGFGRYTTTPALAGLTQTQAEASAKKLGFTLKYGDPVYEEKIAKGKVVSQLPLPKARILSGGVITLTLSRGPERHPVPDVTGVPYDQAVAALADNKMTVKRADAYDQLIPLGLVISTSPQAGKIEKPGAVVTVTVSKGRPPITVPNVVGQDFNTANQTLTALGLQVAQSQANDDHPAGTVIKQSLPIGAGAVKGQSIILTVSLGPPSAPVPDVTNQNLTFDQAALILKNAGFVAVNVFNATGGQVRNQSPAPGTIAQKGTQVQLWVYP